MKVTETVIKAEIYKVHLWQYVNEPFHSKPCDWVTEFDSEDYKNVTKYKMEQKMRADMKANPSLEEIAIRTTEVNTTVKDKIKDFKPESFKPKKCAFAK